MASHAGLACSGTLQLTADDNPFLLLHSHRELYAELVRQLPPAVPGLIVWAAGQAEAVMQ